MKTIIALISLILITTAPNFAQSLPSNDGFYNVANFEYFAPERPLDTKKDDRSRIFVLPQLKIDYGSHNLTDQNGLELKTTEDIQKAFKLPTPPPKKKWHQTIFRKKVNYAPPRKSVNGRIVVQVESKNPDYFDKCLLLGNIFNLKQMQKFYSDEYKFMSKHQTKEEIFIQHGRNIFDDIENSIIPISGNKIKDIISSYTFENVTPSGLISYIRINGNIVGSTNFNQDNTLSPSSTFSIDLNGLDQTQAIEFLKGNFTIHTDFGIVLNYTQIANAEHNLNNYVKIISKEVFNQKTIAKSKKSGFLFWTSIRKSVNTYAKSIQNTNASSTRNSSSRIYMKDVKSQQLMSAVESYVFRPFQQINSNGDKMSSMIEDHQKGAIQAEQENKKELRDAHNKYVEYLKSVQSGNEDEKKGNEALDLLTKAMSKQKKEHEKNPPKNPNGNGESNDAISSAGSAYAASGNPYVAAAVFLAKGIIYKKQNQTGTYHYTGLRNIVWNDRQNSIFSGLITQQVEGNHSISQAQFPIIRYKYERMLENERKRIESKRIDPTKEFSPFKIEDTKSIIKKMTSTMTL